MTTECEQGKDLTEFFKPRDQLDSKQETDVEDSEVELGHAEYFNQNLPDLGAFVKEEPGSTDGDAENVEQPQPVPA